jgi:hypothetical protein
MTLFDWAMLVMAAALYVIGWATVVRWCVRVWRR